MCNKSKDYECNVQRRQGFCIILMQNPCLRCIFLLVAIYFDIDEDKELEDRDYNRFIIEAGEHNFRSRFYKIIEEKIHC